MSWLWVNVNGLFFCENAQLFTAKQPPTKSQAVKKKEKNKEKKNRKKLWKSPHQLRDTSELPSDAFRPID
jgi:hypothetical protein